MFKNTKIIKLKENFEKKFPEFSLLVDKGEMIDPANEMRCERLPLDDDFGSTVYFTNDLNNPYGDKGFHPDSLFIYCNDNQKVIELAKEKGAGKMPSHIADFEKDMREALVMLASPTPNSDSIAIDLCNNIAKPVDEMTDKYLCDAFNLILRSALDPSARYNKECLQKTWFASENGYIPGSQSFADTVMAFNSWKQLNAASRKENLVNALNKSLEAFNTYSLKYQETLGGLTCFLEHARKNFLETQKTEQAKAVCFIEWKEDNKTSFSNQWTTSATHAMVLNKYDDSEDPQQIVEHETKLVTEWFNDEIYALKICKKDDQSCVLGQIDCLKSDLENNIDKLETLAQDIKASASAGDNFKL